MVSASTQRFSPLMEIIRTLIRFGKPLTREELVAFIEVPPELAIRSSLRDKRKPIYGLSNKVINGRKKYITDVVSPSRMRDGLLVLKDGKYDVGPKAFTFFPELLTSKIKSPEMRAAAEKIAAASRDMPRMTRTGAREALRIIYRMDGYEVPASPHGRPKKVEDA